MITLIGYLITLPTLIHYNNSMKTLILNLLDLVTDSIPPQLPIAMSIGIGYSIGRLKQKNIVALNHQNINTVGEIQIVAFDKTGTLTENKLNVKGVLINSVIN